MTSLFTRIIEGTLPGHFALRDDQCVVFMTISPITTGHALVVPRTPVDQWIDMPADLNAHLFSVARHVGLAQRAAFGTDRVGLLIAGFEVNHCHLHCVPANAIADLDFSRQEQGVSAERLADAAVRLAAQLRADGVAGAL
jgi:diadenosine tetraphosphate (Ap4A) HIT family hydrolase